MSKLLVSARALAHLAGVLNNRQHAGMPVTGAMWSHLRDRTNKVKAAIAEHDDKVTLPPVTRQQFGAILAGLRLYQQIMPDIVQQLGDEPVGEHCHLHLEETEIDAGLLMGIATDCPEEEALRINAVDELVEALNCPPKPPSEPEVQF